MIMALLLEYLQMIYYKGHLYNRLYECIQGEAHVLVEIIMAQVPLVWGKSKTSLHNESIRGLEAALRLNFKPFESLSIEDGRKQYAELFALFSTNKDYQGHIEERDIPCEKNECKSK